MGHKLLLTVLVLSIFASGCVSKSKAPLLPSETTVPSEEASDEIPDVSEVTEDELTPEVDLELNDTVDLGSLL